MDATQWVQGLGFMTRPAEEGLVLTASGASATAASTATGTATRTQQAERKLARPQKEQALPCPRCSSTNTKFCYYNNYSLTQPRYFCKACRRYWTEGGSLRSVPVGGGSRKNKRHTVKNANLPPPPPQVPTSQAYGSHSFFGMGAGNSDGIIGSAGMSAMELLRSGGIAAARGLGGPLLPMTIPMPAAPAQPEGLFPLVDHAGSAGGNMQLFPFGDMRQEQHRGQDAEPAVFWNGMMGGGGADHGSW